MSEQPMKNSGNGGDKPGGSITPRTMMEKADHQARAQDPQSRPHELARRGSLAAGLLENQGLIEFLLDDMDDTVVRLSKANHPDQVLDAWRDLKATNRLYARLESALAQGTDVAKRGRGVEND